MTTIIIFLLLLIALLFFSVWNFLILRRLQSSRDSAESIKDSWYWELKYKMEFLVAVSAMGAAVLVFLGYESLQTAKDSVKSEMRESMVSLQGEIDRSAQEIQNTDKKLSDLKFLSDSIHKTVGTAGSQVNLQVRKLIDLEKRINIINDKNIVQQDFYVVRSLKLLFEHETQPGSNRVYFKDLVTDEGDILPRFSRPPLVIPISQSNMEVGVFNINETFFDAFWGPTSIGPEIPDTLRYSVIIIGK